MKTAFSVLAIACLIAATLVALQPIAQANFMPPPPPPLPRIYIRANGTIEPTSAPVQVSGNIYTLTTSPGSVVIEVQRDNLVLNGAGFSLTGKYYENGIILTGRINVTVRGIEAQQFGAGIYMANSVNCTVKDNRLHDNQRGIQLISSSKGNLLSNNLIFNNSGGVSIYFCGGNTFRGNIMQKNSINLNVYVGYLDNHDTLTSSEFENDIDASNTVDGKPVCYWTNQHNRTVPPDAGYLGLINCDGITAKGLTLGKQWTRNPAIWRLKLHHKQKHHCWERRRGVGRFHLNQQHRNRQQFRERRLRNIPSRRPKHHSGGKQHS